MFETCIYMVQVLDSVIFRVGVFIVASVSFSSIAGYHSVDMIQFVLFSPTHALSYTHETLHLSLSTDYLLYRE